MPVMICRVCGAKLDPAPVVSICECGCCRQRLLVPKPGSQKKQAALNHACELLSRGAFDEAFALFAEAAADDPGEVTACLGQLLCKYGVLYVKDQASGNYQPICLRPQGKNMLDDPLFEHAYDHAAGEARRVIREEMGALEEQRRRSYGLLKGNPTYEVFICCRADDVGRNTREGRLAHELYQGLTARGVRTFYAPTALVGRQKEDHAVFLYSAMEAAKLMLVVGDEAASFTRPEVKTEWAFYDGLTRSPKQRGQLIPICCNASAASLPTELSGLRIQVCETDADVPALIDRLDTARRGSPLGSQKALNGAGKTASGDPAYAAGKSSSPDGKRQKPADVQKRAEPQPSMTIDERDSEATGKAFQIEQSKAIKVERKKKQSVQKNQTQGKASGKGKAAGKDKAPAKEKKQEQTLISKSKKPGIGNAAIVISAIAACAAIILGVCFSSHINGNKLMEAGDYEGAIKAFKNDLFFSGENLIEATRMAGEDAFAEADYITSASFFAQLGDSGRARWSDSIYEQAKALIATNDPEGALEQLALISEEKRAQEQMGRAQLLVAERLFDAGELEEAIAAAESIGNTKYADVNAFLMEAYYRLGEVQLRGGNAKGALASFQKCKGSEKAEACIEILQSLVDENYYEAAVMVNSAVEEASTDFSRDQWRGFFLKEMGNYIGFPSFLDQNGYV